MGGSPPPPPPPAPQPREGAKEASMYWRNRAYDEAVDAATRSYTAASILKALVDLLDPLTDQQLRNAINEHYRIVNEYRRAQIIYTTTVRTFTDVDSLIRAAIERLSSARQLGETHLNEFDRSVIQYTTSNVTLLYTKQSEIQQSYVSAASNLSIIKNAYENSPLTTAENEHIYNEQYSNIQTFCRQASNIYENVSANILEMSQRIDNQYSLTTAGNTFPVVVSGIDDVSEQLRNTTAQIQRTYTTNIETYRQELERASRWYNYYSARANLVRDRNRVIINPAVFRSLLDLAKSAHMNAVYAALFAFGANIWAYNDRNQVCQ